MKKTLLTLTLLGSVFATGAQAITLSDFEAAAAASQGATGLSTAMTTLKGTTAKTGLAQARTVVTDLAGASAAQHIVLLNAIFGGDLGTAFTGAAGVGAAFTAGSGAAGAAGTRSAAYMNTGAGTIIDGTTFITITVVAYTAIGLTAPTPATAMTNLTADQVVKLLTHSLTTIVTAS